METTTLHAAAQLLRSPRGIFYFIYIRLLWILVCAPCVTSLLIATQNGTWAKQSTTHFTKLRVIMTILNFEKKGYYFTISNKFNGIFITKNVNIFWYMSCLIHIYNYIVISPTYFVHSALALEWTRRWSKNLAEQILLKGKLVPWNLL